MKSGLIRFAVVAVAVLGVADAAMACPMCKAAAEADPKLPTAFMASILFMLSMPFVITTCFGVAFYRLSRRADDVRPDV